MVSFLCRNKIKPGYIPGMNFCYLFNCISVMSGPCSTGELILEIQEYIGPDVTNTCSSLTPGELQEYTCPDVIKAFQAHLS